MNMFIFSASIDKFNICRTWSLISCSIDSCPYVYEVSGGEHITLEVLYLLSYRIAQQSHAGSLGPQLWARFSREFMYWEWSLISWRAGLCHAGQVGPFWFYTSGKIDQDQWISFIPLPTNVWAYLFALFLYVSLESSLLIIGLYTA